MKHFYKMANNINVDSLLAQLETHPELWNENTERKYSPGTPHADMLDIWVRYRDRAELTGPRSFVEPHTPVFYHSWNILTELHDLVFNLMREIRATQLGGILITKMPPGTKIASHDDLGSWHAETFTEKAWIALKANDKCINTCLGEKITFHPGEIWHFDNLTTHSVENNGDTDRITLIVCMRKD